MYTASKKPTILQKTITIISILLVILYGVPNLLYNLTEIQLKKEVLADGPTVQTGYYIGNGRTLSIKGLGFTPDLVIIKSDTATSVAVFKTSNMPAPNMGFFSGTVDNRDMRLTLDSDGFTVSEADQFKLDTDGFTLRNSASINIANIRYTWTAIGGSDCTNASSLFCVGTYTGNAAATQSISLPFQPNLVIVKRNTAVAAHFKTTAQGVNNNTLWFTTSAVSTSGYINSLDASGFTVATTDNAGGGTFYYMAFKESSTFFKQGSYTGNSTDNRTVTGVGFKPDLVIVKNATNATTANRDPLMNLRESYGSSSSYIGSATANMTTGIKSLITDGFSLGTSANANNTGDTYYYLAFTGASTASGTGTFRMAEGTYTGNGTIQSIENIGFAPDLVIVKNDAAQLSVFRTKLMALDSTAYFTGATANTYGAILSLNEDSFDVGANVTTNASGNTYQWQAFGNAYSPHNGTGASNFAIGAYYGNGIDDRDITNLPFQPDLLVVKSITSAGAATLRTSAHGSNVTSYFQATIDGSNLIQSFATNGFQVGSSAVLNTAAVLNFWFAFKSGDDFKVGTYTGNTPSTQTIEIDPLAFQSDLIWTVPSTAVGGAIKPSTLSDPNSQYFLNTANATNQITAITSKGFTVGAGTSANSAATMWYCAWKIPYIEPPTNLPGTPGTPTFSETTSTETLVSWSAASGADYYIVERSVDRSGTPGLFKYVTTTAATSMLDSALNANQKYWYRVKATNPNGNGQYSESASLTTTAQSLQMQTGYYVGTGDQFSITGLGFAPELVLVKSDTSNIPVIYKSASMRDNVMGFFSANADGSVVNLNVENVRYTWIAFAGSDCSATGYFCLGAYTGNGAAQSITTGFQPDYVSVKNNEAVAAHYKTTSLGANTHSLYYINLVKDTSSNYLRSLDASGFTVGATDSVAGGTFHYFAFKEKANFFKQGTYAGDAVDNRIITGVGFKPDFVITKNGSNATANNTHGYINQIHSYGNSSSYIAATANIVNMIKGLESDGFKLGTDVKVNATSNTYYYLAFGGGATPTGNSTYRMAQGSYTGNGTSQKITGVGFKPDLVFIKSNSTRLQVFRTSLMAGNFTAYLGATSASFADGIISLNDGSFDIGGSTTVNNTGEVYHWQAFGNAYNPITKRGSADFAIGAYYGNGIDNRDIAGLPFQPNFVTVKIFSTSTSSGGVFTTSSHTAGNSSYFLGTADAADFIQALNTDGFQIGTNAVVNTAAATYFWFAFKQGDYFKIGSFPGNGTSQSISISSGFQPNLIFTKTDTAVGGIIKPSTLSDPNSQYFLGTANATNQITAINSDGFSVGAGTGANASGANVRYMAWVIPPYLISITVSDGTVNYQGVELSGAKSTLSTDMPPSGDMQIVTNNSTENVNINIKGHNSTGASCIWTISGLNGHNQYKHQFCNETTNDCSNPPSSYKNLSTTYQRLASNIANNGAVDFHLRITMPSTTSCYEQQSVNVTVQASEI